MSGMERKLLDRLPPYALRFTFYASLLTFP